MGKRNLFMVVGLALALCASDARATSQDSLTVQGVLRDGMGALQTMPANVTVNLWSASTGGTQVYSQSFTGVGVQNGLFSVTLNNIALAGAIGKNPTLWLEMLVNNQSYGRQQVASQMYAAVAEGAYAGLAVHTGTVNGSVPQNAIFFEDSPPKGAPQYVGVFSNPSLNSYRLVSEDNSIGIGQDSSSVYYVSGGASGGAHDWYSFNSTSTAFTKNMSLASNGTLSLPNYSPASCGGNSSNCNPPIAGASTWSLDLHTNASGGPAITEGIGVNNELNQGASPDTLWFTAQRYFSWYLYDAAQPSSYLRVMRYDGSSLQVRGGAVSNASPDLAETIGAANDVRVADVVCADPLHAEHVVRCDASRHAVLGVISDGKGGFLINAHGQKVDGKLTGAPLVLAGRVPVRVSTINGPIAIGDYLAPSEIPGVAVKAIGPGRTVGIALAAFDGKKAAIGKVLALIEVGEQGATAEIAQLRSENNELRKQLAALEGKVDALIATESQHGARHERLAARP